MKSGQEQIEELIIKMQEKEKELDALHQAGKIDACEWMERYYDVLRKHNAENTINDSH
jgi:hypothetical protein